MTSQGSNNSMPSSCLNMGKVGSSLDPEVSSKSTSSLSEAFDDLKLEALEQVPSPVESGNRQSPVRLIQNCGPDCMITQRIVDKLLSRMLDLENERSELLAANRSWAVQFQLMKEGYEGQIRRLEEKLKASRRGAEKKLSLPESGKKREHRSSSMCQQSTSYQLDLLAHQAEAYKEDFLEERKARARAHAQIESLRNELKRERKTRAKIASVGQLPSNEGLDAVFT